MLPISIVSLRFLVFLGLGSSLCKADGPPVNPVALRVSGGRFLYNEKPACLIGVNYFDGFQRALNGSEAPAVERYKRGLKFLREREIPFIRFAATGFYPNEWRLYLDNPEAYYRKLDAFVTEAERQQIGLIPNLFWAFFTVPDICREPISSWGLAESKSRKFMRKFTREFIARYRGRRIIWGWEFGNEYLAEVDLPGPMRQQWAVPKMGTPPVRVEADKLRHEEVSAAYADFARTVREMDPERPIFTGDTIPRSSAWHLKRGEGWKPDSPDEYEKILAASNPKPLDTIGLHIYHWDVAAAAAGYGLSQQGPEATLQAACRLAERAKQGLWLGEFGCKVGEKDAAARKRQIQAMLDLIVKYRVQLSAYWVFDSDNPDIEIYNTAPGNENAYVFEQIAEASRRLKKLSQQ